MKRVKVIPERCNGCLLCALSCSIRKFGESNPKKSAIKVIRNPFNRIEYPIVCSQCEEGLCLDACPTGCLYCNGNGIIKQEISLCVGCGKCYDACPFKAMIKNENDKIYIKCDLCDNSDEPVCVKICPLNALEIEF